MDRIWNTGLVGSIDNIERIKWQDICEKEVRLIDADALTARIREVR